MGTLRNKVRAQPTTGSPPCRPDAAVSPLQAPAAAPFVKGVTLRSHAWPVFAPATVFPDMYEGPAQDSVALLPHEGPRPHP